MMPDHLPTLLGDGIRLRPFRDADLELVRSVADDPLIPLITTVPTSGSSQDALAYIARQHERLRTGTGYSFAIADAASDRAVGQIGLWLSQLAQGRASTGYWVAPAWRGRGIVRAALLVVSDWALSLGPVQRLELYVEPWNQASWRAAEACGFQREGLLRSWQQVGTERKDMFVYSRLPGTPPTQSPEAGSAPQVIDAPGRPAGSPPRA